jgi:hypothetical protein
MTQPRETIVVTESRTVDVSRTTYPWLVDVRVHLKGGGAGTDEGPGEPGFAIIELYDEVVS